VLKWLAWRLVEATVLAFATLGFCYVPLGERTGYEHARAVATSPEARDLAAGVLEVASWFRTPWYRQLIEVVGPPPSTDDDEGPDQ
jgi:hypothetical protein